jgi:hypothetical protein
MKVVILYRPKSEHSSATETFIRDYQMRHGSDKIEVINVDDREGIATASLYDIQQYPAILALATDGVMLAMWQGPQLPLIDEVASYTLER